MYRIHFDENANRFVIQVLRHWFIWRTILKVHFETYDEATEYVARIGLSRLYRDGSMNAYRAHMQGA